MIKNTPHRKCSDAGQGRVTGFQQVAVQRAVPLHRLRGRRTGRDSCSARQAPDGGAGRG